MLRASSLKKLVRLASHRLLGEGLADMFGLRLAEVLRARPDQFDEGLTASQRRALFARSVNFIEVETHSFCNRTCWFCPNAVVDRRTFRAYLPEAVYLQVLADLASIGYCRRFYFSHYNEPFADEIIYTRIAQAREALPHADLRAHTNGDYLTPERMDRAIDCGLNELQIGVYLPDTAAWTRSEAHRQLRKLVSRLRLRVRQRSESPGTRVTYDCSRDGTLIFAFCPNYQQEGLCRGGTVPGMPDSSRKRTSPCFYAFTDLYIEYNGCVMPCCNLRSDIDSHRDSTFGRVDATPGSIFDAWGSGVAAHWRRAMATFDPKEGPCRTCHAREWPDTPTARRIFAAAMQVPGKAPSRATSGETVHEHAIAVR